MSVRGHISGTAGPIFTKFLCRSPVAVARSSSGGVAICYVGLLPVLYSSLFTRKVVAIRNESRLVVVGHLAMRGRLAVNLLCLLMFMHIRLICAPIKFTYLLTLAALRYRGAESDVCECLNVSYCG